ncbi:MAG: CehA/McbA family metallohydrolase [candidate division WOR-3 bacterium]|nr:CehA/McbA family metallohydrolase [candidate division WOR-3 bacterium]
MRQLLNITIVLLVLGINQLGFGYKIYWANLHSHTALSDGQGTPREAYLYARDTAQIDVLAVTDHSSYITQANYQYLRALADSFTENGRFVAIAGQEFGSLSGFGHLSIFEADSLCPISAYDLEKTYQWIAKHRASAQFNHPQQGNFNKLLFNRNGDKYISATEVVNGSGNYTPYYEEQYLKALNQGWQVAPVANQDNHRRRWGNATTIQGQIPLTGIWADTLTKAAILAAINNGRIYACEIKPVNDKILLKEFSINNKLMGDIYYTTDKSVTIKLNVEAINKFDKIYLYKNGVIADSIIADTNQLQWIKQDTITNGYYFFKGIQQDGDRFWTGPIWVNYNPALTSGTIEAWPNPIKSQSVIKFPKEIVGNSEMFIYNLEGKLIYQEQKNYNEEHFWDGKDQKGKDLDDGIYLVVIKVSNSHQTKMYKGKIALLSR